MAVALYVVARAVIKGAGMAAEAAGTAFAVAGAELTEEGVVSGAAGNGLKVAAGAPGAG